MFDIGGPELLLIVLGIIVLFGPKKIPEVARMIGKGIQKVRSAQSQLKEQMEEIQTEFSQVNNSVVTSGTNPPIKEINVKNLNEELISNNNADFNDPYGINSREGEENKVNEEHLNGKSHGFAG